MSIKLDIPVDYAQMIKRILENHQTSSIPDLRRIAHFVTMLENKLERQWNPAMDQQAKCKCGHPYERHFDGYEDMYPAGCKYCECDTFESTDEAK